MKMYQLIEEGFTPIPSEKIDLDVKHQYLCILNHESFLSNCEDFKISRRIAQECEDRKESRFECYDGFDFIVLNIPQTFALNRKPEHLCIYFRKNLLLFTCDQTSFMSDFIKNTRLNEIKVENLGRLFRLFLEYLIHHDRNELSKIEVEIADLEENFLFPIKDELIGYISQFRRKLLLLKHYYEELLDISEAIEENENNLINQEELRYFKILTNRIERLLSNVLRLRDYITQVREAYQAQLDISLNNVMKLFTVITSIFLPLSLIVGWYGMNLKMPEYKWTYGYPFIIILSLIVAMGTLFYFKKNKWF